MFEFLKPKTPKELAEYNKEKIIKKNTKILIKKYDKIINQMIKEGITYSNYSLTSLSIYSFQEESSEKAILKLKNKWHLCGIEFKIIWKGYNNRHIGISVEFI